MKKKQGGDGASGGAPRIVRRVLMLAVLGGALWFAIEGGEYTTFDLLSQRSRQITLDHDVAILKHSVDSLVKWRTAIATDPIVQERIAREAFGMVRGNKELLYRFIDRPDTTKR